MHIRFLTAVSVLAAMGMLAGCGEPGEPQAGGETSYHEDADQMPAPETAVPDTRPNSGVAGTEQPMTGQSPTTANQPMDAMGQDKGMTEFAALDTDSDGKLSESEWQPDMLHGLKFDQIDEDASGSIDENEFRQALSMATQGAQPGTTKPGDEDLDPTTP